MESSAWRHPYLKTTVPRDADDETWTQEVVKTLVALHRSRQEPYTEGRHFYAIRKRQSDEVTIGFADPNMEVLITADPLCKRIPDTTLDMVRRVLS